MQRARFLDVIYTHTSGGVLGIVHSGIRYPVGTDIVGQRRFLEQECDWIRRAIVFEPRGYENMYGVFLTPPSRPGSHGGIVFFDQAGFLDGCGHGTIGLTMAMVSYGLVEETRPATTINLDTVAGPLSVSVAVTDAGVESSEIENVPAFVVERNVAVDVPGIGPLKADIAFGGNFFALIEWNHPEIAIGPEHASRLREAGIHVKRTLNARLKLKHPTEAAVDPKITIVTFYNTRDATDGDIRNVHILGNGQVARSPGGTGTSAMVALLNETGFMKGRDGVRIQGLLGAGHFVGRVIGSVTLGAQPAVVTTIKGKANLLGYAKWIVDPQDEVAAGYSVG